MAKRPTQLSYPAVIQALYHSMLGREPDADGGQTKIDALRDGSASLTEIIGSILNSEEFAAVHKSADTSARLTNDQTQFGEFEILLRLWINQFANHRIVVDVGARGKARSNSYDLMRSFGWRGYLFEANPRLIESIRGEFQGLDVEIIQCAVSDYTGEATFHLGINDDVSSLNAEAAAGWGPLAGEVTVPVERLGNILRDYGVPQDFDLLSIDIEGEDVKVLNDVVVAFGYRPRWIIIEASYDFATKSLEDLPTDDLVRQTYRIVGQTPANLILGLIEENPFPGT